MGGVSGFRDGQGAKRPGGKDVCGVELLGCSLFRRAPERTTFSACAREALMSYDDSLVYMAMRCPCPTV
jgi:hypothetical protein